MGFLPCRFSPFVNTCRPNHYKLAYCRNAHRPSSNASNVHDYVTWLLKQIGGTFKFKGPWFINMTFMVTSDPMNIHHMLIKNFSNYTKGPKFQEIFDVLGDGIFISNSDSWSYQRKLLQSLTMHREFELFFQQVVKGKVDKGLIPILDYISSSGIEVDLQDIFQRFTFNNVCLVALGIDPNCLSIEFPDVSHTKAFDQLEECLIYRHIMPESCWKLQRWLQIGSEKKLSNGLKILDQFIYKCISSRKEEQSQSRAPKTEVEEFNLLTAIRELVEEIGGTIKSDKFL